MDDIARRPAESAISEGNLAENPIFVLSNKDAKPPIGLGADGKPDLSEYTRSIFVGKSQLDGREIERSVTLKANPQFGFPTMFAYRLLIAIIDECRKTNFQSPLVYINRNELAQRLGNKKPGKSDYLDIQNALEAMRTLSLQFSDTWYDKKKGQRGNILCEGLIAGFRFVDDRQATLPLPGFKGIDPKRSYVKLSDVLFASLRENYFHGVDLDYMNALKSPLAQRLYAYLAKKDYRKQSYSEDIRLLASKLNLKKRSPSAIWDMLEPKKSGRNAGPLELLRRETRVDSDGKVRPRRFLESWVADREKQMLTVYFYDEVRSQVASSLASASRGVSKPNSR